MKKCAAVFIYKGGLSHWYDVDAEQKYIYFPEEKMIVPELTSFEWEEVLIVDRNIVTGTTLEKAKRFLMLSDNQCIKAGSVIGSYAENIIDKKLPQPDIKGYILAFSGPAGVAKSFLAKGIACYRGISFYKVGEYARLMNPGKYGECLAEKEKQYPFIVVEKMAEDMMHDNAQLVIVDGLKNLKAAIFLSYVLRRPLIGFFVDAPFKEKMIVWRQNADDAYSKERFYLFQQGLQELNSHFIPVSSANFETVKPIADTLERFGFKCPHRIWGWDIFGTKDIWLDLYARYSSDDRSAGIEIGENINYHNRYAKKYELDGEAALMVIEVATAFRFIDDILDEHTTRWGKPARWVQTSLIETLAEASALTAKARLRARKLGCEAEFNRMFKSVLDAVYYEIAVEEGRAVFQTEADWEKAAGREAHFRAFIGYLKGEASEKYYQDGLQAQMKDDLRGAEKGGREDTDGRLNRPLWQKAKHNSAVVL